MTSNLTKLIQQLNKNVQDQEKLALPLLCGKLKKLAEQFPFDQTIVMTSDVLAKVSDKQLFLTRNDLRSLYKRLYSRNTKFAEYFADELGAMETSPSPKLYEKHEAPIDTRKDTNQVLSAVFSSAIDKTVPLKLYSDADGEKAVHYVNSTLEAWNVKSSKVSIAEGNEHFILIKADYETPKGLASVFVPIEIEAGKVLQPSVFVGQNGLTELNHQNVKEHLLSYVKKSAAQPSYSKEIETPHLAQADNFEEKFKSALGVATFKFGNDKVNLGLEAVVRSLAGLGLSHPQVKVIDAQDNTIVYGVVAGKVAFKVPVKLTNNRITSPELMLCNNAVMPLNKASINQLFHKNESDYGAAAAASTLYGMKTAELIQSIKDAADEQNYNKAEEALNVLQQSGDKAGYKAGMEVYMSGLTMKKTAEKQSSCSMVVKSGSTQYSVCGHTGLPLHKVYQDQHGNCQPLYRQHIPQQTDSVLFNTAKILG